MRLTTTAAAILVTPNAGVGTRLCADTPRCRVAARDDDDKRRGSHAPIRSGNHLSGYQATFAWRIWQGREVTVSIEVLFIPSPAFMVATPGGSLPKGYVSLYLTPGVRVTALPDGRVSAFGSTGGGY